MSFHRSLRPALALRTLLSTAVLGLLGSTSPAFAGPAAQNFYITNCSLSCTSGAGGSQVFCSTVDVHENEVIEVVFSLPVDPSSLSPQSFQVTDVNNGTTPAGTLRVSALDPHKVTFEPDPVFTGGVGFSFERNRSYEIRLPGTGQGDSGPFVTSTAGDLNDSRMLCTVLTSLGTLPPVRSECITTPNSAGPGAVMGASGSASVFFNDLVLETTGLPPVTVGTYVLGQDPALTPLGAGFLCLGGTLQRLGVTQSNANGEASLPLDLPSIPGGISVVAGATWRFQHVFRDSTPIGATFSASDAIRVTFEF